MFFFFFFGLTTLVWFLATLVQPGMRGLLAAGVGQGTGASEVKAPPRCGCSTSSGVAGSEMPVSAGPLVRLHSRHMKTPCSH